MPSKRAQVPQEPFAKRPSALEKLTGSTTRGTEAAPSADRNTVIRQNGETATEPEDTVTVHAQLAKTSNEKISFYLRPDQVDKLDDLVRAYKKRTGIRLNRNELVRRLIDLADVMWFDATERHGG